MTIIIIDGTTDDAFVKELDAEVTKVKGSKEWRREYMTLLMRDRENVEKGIEQGELRQIISMVYKKVKKGKNRYSKVSSSMVHISTAFWIVNA